MQSLTTLSLDKVVLNPLLKMGTMGRTLPYCCSVAVVSGLFVIPWVAAQQTPPSLTVSLTLLKHMSIDLSDAINICARNGRSLRLAC